MAADFDPEQILIHLDAEQRQVATHLSGPVRILAGAGTGKTTAITHRIAYGVHLGTYQPGQLLALSFTTRAAGELRSRLAKLGVQGVQARTFHAAALRQLHYFWPKIYQRQLPQIAESKLRFLAQATRALRIEASQVTLKELAAEVEWSKVSNIVAEQYPTQAELKNRVVSGVTPAEVSRVLVEYEAQKRAAYRIDLEDVLLLTLAMLSQEEQVARQVRQQYRRFVVDEFQDVSPVQQSLLQTWLGERDELCVVGDPAQTIYSFAGAQADFLVDFTKRFPEATSFQLTQNYRSTPEIVDLANQLLIRADQPRVKLQAQRPSGPAVKWFQAADEIAEANQIAAQISAKIAEGFAPHQLAVLFRINAQAAALEDALTERGIPYEIRGGKGFFSRPEVKQALVLLRAESKTAGELELQVKDVLAGMGYRENAANLGSQQREIMESLRTILVAAQIFITDYPQASLADFVAEIEQRAAEQHPLTGAGVTLATLHTAKGLEWPVVFLAGVADGSLPINFAKSAAEISEELRLLYVGITRAQTELQLSWAQARTPGGSPNRKVSRFLLGLAPNTRLETKPAKSKKTVRCGTCSKVLFSVLERASGYCKDCPIPYDAEVLAALKEWRKSIATATEVPAFVVFSDATLIAIAAQLPKTDFELTQISGIGPAKLAKYGAELLQILQKS